MPAFRGRTPEGLFAFLGRFLGTTIGFNIRLLGGAPRLRCGGAVSSPSGGLRELEVLERATDKANLSVILGDGGLADRVVKLL
jgi:hypothetical protein